MLNFRFNRWRERYLELVVSAVRKRQSDSSKRSLKSKRS